MRPRLGLAVLALALMLAPLAAPLLAATHPLAALLIRNFFSRLCHQDPSRSFVLDGSPVAVCVRCLGIYWGVALGMVLRMKRARGLLAVAMVLNVLDVASSASAFARQSAADSVLVGAAAWSGGGRGSFLDAGAIDGKALS